MLWTYVVNDRSGKEIDGTFYKKEFLKTNQKKLINYMSTGKDTIICLIVG